MEEIIKFNVTTMKAISKEGELYSLNDLWKLLGSPKYKEPKRWVLLPDSVRYIEKEIEIEKDEKSVLLSKKGRNGGSYGSKRVFVEYARYLDKGLAIQINDLFLQELKAKENPDLYLERYRSSYKKKGKSDDWIDKRMKSINTRNELTSTLSHHGVHGDGFRRCTNASYEGLLGCKAPALRKHLGIEKKDSIRDNMSKTQLTALELSEDLAKQRIEKRNLYGVDPCEAACKGAADVISVAVTKFLNS